ncbi:MULTISPECIES: hypothetical protein [unclassified Modestobacter]
MNDWPFADSPRTRVYTTQPVLDGAPVQDVFHDPDGDWQVHCGTTMAVEDARVVHLGQLVQVVPELVSLADLPPGWGAHRGTGPGDDEWHRRPTTLRARVRALLRRD